MKKKSPFHHLKQAGKANEPSVRRQLITRGEERACQLVLGAILILGIAVLASMTGCAHSVPPLYTPPSSASVSSALTGTRTEIASTRSAIADAQKHAAALEASAPAADRQEIEDLQDDLAQATVHAQAADSNAAVTSTNLTTFTAQVTNQTATLNQTAKRLDYLEPKYEKSVALLWKWRLIALGIIAVILGVLFLKYGSRLAAWAATIAAKIP